MKDQISHGPVRVLGIDPGTSTTGLALLEVDLENRTERVVRAFTCKVSETAPGYHFKFEHYGSRMAKIMVQSENLENLLKEEEPDYIIAEAPYFRRFPQPYQALSECVLSFKLTAWRHRMLLPFSLIDPTSAKENIGVELGKGKSKNRSDKTLVEKCVRERKSLSFDIEPDFDEHTFDAISIACYLIDQQLYNK